MGLDLTSLLIFAIAAVLYAGLLSGRWRGWALLIGSALGIYWLQPNLAPRFASFALQTGTIAITVLLWALSRKRDDETQQATWHEDRRTLIVLLMVVFGVALLRFLPADFRPIAYRPPSPLTVALAVGLVSLIFLGIAKLTDKAEQRKVLTGGILFIVVLFVVLKTPLLVTAVSQLWRSFTNQDTALASPSDLAWLGFSYVAFRLIHTLRDRQTGILPVLSLREYVTYVIFAPAYIAGPIDRAERFVKDFRALPEMVGLDAVRFGEGGYRIAVGLFKKFVVADLLAQGMSLTVANAEQATSSLALWVLLYGYALRLFFDFAGYTDIAIGLGILFGIRLPENFNRPYLTHKYHRFLAKLARHLKQLGAILRLHTAISHPAAPQTAPLAPPSSSSSRKRRRCSPSACGMASVGTMSFGACGTARPCLPTNNGATAPANGIAASTTNPPKNAPGRCLVGS